MRLAAFYMKVLHCKVKPTHSSHLSGSQYTYLAHDNFPNKNDGIPACLSFNHIMLYEVVGIAGDAQAGPLSLFDCLPQASLVSLCIIVSECIGLLFAAPDLRTAVIVDEIHIHIFIWFIIYQYINLAYLYI